MNPEKFTIKAQEVLQESAGIAQALQHQAIEPEHLLKAILESDPNVTGYLFKKLNISSALLENRLQESLNRRA